MPIRRDLKPLYGPDWPEISRRIRFERARGRCEACDRPHGIDVRVLPDGRWFDVDRGFWRSGRGERVAWPSDAELLVFRYTLVILTCGHRDHDPANNADDNLACWCSRCHLLHDMEHHRIQRRITWRGRQAVGDLFDGEHGVAGYPRNS